MCGIAGMIHLTRGDQILEKMIATMLRRGPDDAGVYQQGPCCLLHTRLAVIDPDRGHQPMKLHWAGEDYTMVYNGELYNTDTIRNELKRMGHFFSTHTDTEVVLHAYVQWGDQCLRRFNGIYAFGVWEEKRQRLFIARDRMGVKPLFYKLHEGGLLFASEIKTILAYPTVKAELDGEGAAEVMLLGPGRTPGSGVFRGIRELEPGCCGYFADGKLVTDRYWKLTDREHRDTFEETLEQVRYLVTDAIKGQMVSDVPIGTFLSGGLDSSLISAVCASELERRGQRLHTFSLDFADNDKYFIPDRFQPNSDGHYIRLMEMSLNTISHWTVLTPQQLVDSLEAATTARDLPGMADVDFSLLVFCGEIRKEVKVALSGECADEIFGGYPWYRDPQIREMAGFPWAQNTRHRASFLSPEITEKIDPESYIQDRYEETIAQCDILPGTSPEEKRMKEMVNLNQRWFMQTLLDRKDRMSMYHGLEIRVPFCDHRIAEYLYGVPWAYKNYKGKEKGLLRQSAEGLLPHQILWRKKCPYPKTYHPGYLQMVSDRLRQLLEDPQAPIFQIVRRQALEGLLTAEYAWPWYGQLMKVPQTIAYMLQVNDWLQKYKISVI